MNPAPHDGHFLSTGLDQLMKEHPFSEQE